MEELDPREVIAHITALAERLRAGLAEPVRGFNVMLRQSGSVAMPLFRFGGGEDFAMQCALCTTALAVRGDAFCWQRARFGASQRDGESAWGDDGTTLGLHGPVVVGALWRAGAVGGHWRQGFIMSIRLGV